MELDPKYDSYDFPYEAKVQADGHPGHLKPDEQALVFQLRMLLEAEGFTKRLDTITLLRFLRAREWAVMEAKKMFIDCEKWRHGIKLDNLVPSWVFPKDKIFEYYPQYYHKTDKDGRPVYIEKLGGIDLAKMSEITAAPDTNDKQNHLAEVLLTNLAVEHEKLADPRLPACSRKAGHLVETCCTIMDLKGVGLTNIASVYSHLQRATAISQNYYPERLGRLYVINTPMFFSTAWAVIKGWIDPVTAEKIHILGWDLKELHRQVPKENLPVEYGGTCNCPGGCRLSDMGPWKEDAYSKPSWWETDAAKTKPVVGAANKLEESKAPEPAGTAMPAPA